MRFEKNINSIIEGVLKEDAETRDNNSLLYLKVVSELAPNIGSMPFSYVMTHIEDLHIPEFTTINRTRQLIQAKNKDLQGTKHNEDDSDMFMSLF